MSLVALLGACGGSSASKGASGGSSGGSSTSASAGAPVHGGTFSYDMEIAPQCADPDVSPQFATYQLSRPVVDSLVASADGKTFEPWLATSWKISPDAKQYTFVLRQGVTFSDGTPLNAQAVKINFDRISNPATKSQYARTLLGPYAGTTVVDPNTVQVNFTTGFNSFLAAASTANLGIQSPTALAKNPPCSPPVGSGPFVITSYNSQEGATLTNRPDYRWDPGTAANKGPAYLSKIVINFVPNDTTREGSLTSGQVDSIEAPPSSDVARLKSEGFQIIQHTQPGGVYDEYIDQTTAPWNNLKARQALRDALNVPAMINALYQGVYQPAWGPIAQSTPSYDKAVENSWHQDLAQANQDLDQLGYTKRDGAGFRVNSAGKELDAVMPSADSREQRPQLALLIKQAEAKVGINVQINSDPTTSLDQIENGGFGLSASAHVDASADILRLLFGSRDTPPQGGLNYGQINDPHLDQWLTQATSSLDPATQDQLYGKVQTYAIDNALVIPLYQEQTLNAVTSKLHGVTFDATGYVLYYDAWLSH